MASISDRVARVWNRTALGVGVLFGLFAVYRGLWLRAAIVFFVLVPLYFWLHDYVDAP